MILREFGIPWLGLLFAASLSFAQDQPGGSGMVLRAYPNTDAGLTAQIEDACAASHAQGSQQIHSMLDRFALPNPDEWLQKAVGEKYREISGQYAGKLASYQSMLTEKCSPDTNPERPKIEAVKLIGQQAQPPSVAVAPEVHEQLQAFRFVLHTAKARVEWATTFVYESGAFRYIGDGAYPFWEVKRAVTVGKDVQAATLIHQVPPDYPDAWKKDGIQGTVHLRATIAKDGSVQDVTVIDGDARLAKSAQKAVKEWRYKPTMLNGQPVEVHTTIAVVFALNASP
jgi:TonB family protein